MIWKVIGWFTGASPLRLFGLAAMVAGILYAWGWHTHQVKLAVVKERNTLIAAWDKERSELKLAGKLAEAQREIITASRIRKFQEAKDASEVRAETDRVAAVAAGDALARLRKRAAQAVNSGCSQGVGNSTTSTQESATPGGMCAELLDRLGQAYRRVSEFADQSDNDDAACRNSFQALK